MEQHPELCTDCITRIGRTNETMMAKRIMFSSILFAVERQSGPNPCSWRSAPHLFLGKADRGGIKFERSGPSERSQNVSKTIWNNCCQVSKESSLLFYIIKVKREHRIYDPRFKGYWNFLLFGETASCPQS